MFNKMKTLISVTSIAVLSAFAGSVGSVESINKAEGLWGYVFNVSASDDQSIEIRNDILIKKNGKTYGSFYYLPDPAINRDDSTSQPFSISRFIFGDSISIDNELTLTFRAWSYSNVTRDPVNLKREALFESQNFINIIDSDAKYLYNSNYDSNLLNLSLTGNYRGVAAPVLDGVLHNQISFHVDNFPISISTDGSFRRKANNCEINGRLEETSKGFLDLSIKSSGGCLTIKPNTTFSGVVWLDLYGNLIMSAFDVDGNNGIVVVSRLQQKGRNQK